MNSNIDLRNAVKMHILLKIVVIIAGAVALKSADLYSALFSATILVSFMLTKTLKREWIKLIARMGIFLSIYLLFNLFFGAEILPLLLRVMRLVIYLLMILWLKDTTTFESYLADMSSLSIRFESTKIGVSFKRNIYYLNFYVVSTLKIVESFLANYKILLPQKKSFISLFVQVFLKTFFEVSKVKQETESIMQGFVLRRYDKKASFIGIMLITILFMLHWAGLGEIWQTISSR